MAAGEEEWRRSPFYQLVELGARELRRRLGDNYEQGEFERLDRLARDHGMTDYLALSVNYGPGSTLGVVAGLVISYQTNRAGGLRGRAGPPAAADPPVCARRQGHRQRAHRPLAA